LFECWEDVLAPQKSFGNLGDPLALSNPNLSNWLGLDLFGYRPCVECSVFPTCLRGCPRHFKANQNARIRRHQQCSKNVAERELSLLAWVAFKQHFGTGPKSLMVLREGSDRGKSTSMRVELARALQVGSEVRWCEESET